MHRTIAPASASLWLRTAGALLVLAAAPCSPTAFVAAQPAGVRFEGGKIAMARDIEIALALSAAPAALSDRAAVYVWADTGFVKARDGTNGFTCLVERYAGRSIFPVCYDAEASATFLPGIMMRERLVAQGVRYLNASAAVDSAYRKGTLRPPTGRIGYRLSPNAGGFGATQAQWNAAPKSMLVIKPNTTREQLGPVLHW
ncbi:MAG: hypothetical protein ACRENP_23000, partial [Longimicrobiales bacterium]